jgi:hypothetical protein
LTEEERNSIDSTRLRIAKAHSGEDLQELGRRTENSWSVLDTAVHNGVHSNHRFAGGESVKILHRELYTPPPSD